MYGWTLHFFKKIIQKPNRDKTEKKEKKREDDLMKKK